MLFREFSIYSQLYEQMKKELVNLSNYCKGRTAGNRIKIKMNDLKMISENKVPESWFEKGFILDQRTIYEFSKKFLYKKSFLNNFSKIPEMETIIDISKIFDPFGFLISILWNYSIESKVFILV